MAKFAADVETLRAALRRLGPVRVTPKSAWLGPHMNPATGVIQMPGGGAVRNFDIWGKPRPASPEGQKALNILGGMHEGFERSEWKRYRASPPGYYLHGSPRVIMNESNMLSALRGEGAADARRVFSDMRTREAPEEAQNIADALSAMSGGRMPFSYGETRLPRALRKRLTDKMVAGGIGRSEE